MEEKDGKISGMTEQENNTTESVEITNNYILGEVAGVLYTDTIDVPENIEIFNNVVIFANEEARQDFLKRCLVKDSYPKTSAI